MSEGTLWNYSCSDKGLFLPLINEFTWSREARAFLYFTGLIYCFLGVAIIADIFMCAIEKITSKTRKLVLSSTTSTEPEVIEIRVWNDTVANLTLMALGSSAPEILLSIIEIVGNGFKSGELGPGTIVGSAAFNLLVISAVCIISLPSQETRRIRLIKVFAITSFFSVFAYIWLLIILVAVSPNVVELWEALITFLYFPVLVVLAYAADRNFFRGDKMKREKQLELESTEDSQKEHFLDGHVDKDSLTKYLKEVRKNPELTDEDAAAVAAARLMEEKEHSRMWYRVGAIRAITGAKKPKPQLNEKIRQKCEEMVRELMALKEEEATQSKAYQQILEKEKGLPQKTLSLEERQEVAIIEFNASTCAVMENVGQVAVTVKRHGITSSQVSCRVETIDGTAEAEEDYVALKEILTFEPGQTQRKVFVQIINDNQWEPDETFFLKLSLDEGSSGEVALGRTSVMEITILNDDEPGILQFKRRGILVKENVGTAYVPVIRKNGADGIVSTRWRTIDKSAISGRDYRGGEGELIFDHGEVEKNLEIDIIDDINPEKDEHFEIELFQPSGGALIGQVNRTTVTITNDDNFNSIMDRLVVLTNVNVDSLKLHSETWAGQLKDAVNVNGGDLENATRIDYVLHFLTFGWKVFFSLVPPTGFLGGWVTFFVSLGVIGALTAIVGDLASIFGCLVGLKDTVTAITFVALGTSLPDLFASRTAAKQEKYADNAIGNVTGSNSVNVFLGLGLPWLIAAAYWGSKDVQFAVSAGSLSFSVGLYSAASIICIIILMSRRLARVFGKGELGGPSNMAWSTFAVLVIMWFLYVLLSSLQAYGHLF
ncbi:sodium/calcium exchanger 2-like [Limulus polyphemus]|uniref:Sodium/calcium exchanger 2-like n=1 Tax=Limulus polyphemus TaxID=6850 RepID=A0ABM1S7C3_LIMPO|nr:sodium/calcium exchanger 2-like [Limulus polyphemus]XP_022239528.1 sodium/calcium exchanger 2-like [Limulus polyphemus]